MDPTNTFVILLARCFLDERCCIPVSILCFWEASILFTLHAHGPMLSRWAVEGVVVVLQFGETAAKREGVSMFVGMKPLEKDEN